jgi:hypothetical protein
MFSIPDSGRILGSKQDKLGLPATARRVVRVASAEPARTADPLLGRKAMPNWTGQPALETVIGGRFRPASRGAAVGIFAMAAVPAAAWAALTPAQIAAQKAELHDAAAAVRWGFLIGLGAEAAVIVVLALLHVNVRTLIIGKDKRVSTSKTIAAVWTFVVAAALIAVVYADLLDHPQALNATNDADVMGQYALLFGGPLGAAILAKGIVVGQVNKNPGSKPDATSTGPGDLVSNDAGETDLGDFQYVLFNAVALFFVVGMLLHEPLKGLPHIPDVLLGLTSVSAVGYVGKKALPPAAPSGTLAPTHGPAGTPVTITVTGVTPPEQPLAPMWVRFGEEDAGRVDAVPVAGGRAALTVDAPTLPNPPTAAVDVSVITSKGTVVTAGAFTYTAVSVGASGRRPSPAAPGSARPA